jgi:peptidylprolyl isomerase
MTIDRAELGRGEDSKKRLPALAGAFYGIGLVAMLLGGTAGAFGQSQTPAKSQSPTKAQSGSNPAASSVQVPLPSKPASQPGAAPANGADVIARVGNTNVTADDVRAFLAGLGPRQQAVLTQDPVRLNQAVRVMLANQLVLKEALAKKWDQQPAVMAQLDRVRENALVELYLQSVSAAPAGFPSDTEIENLYESNKAAFLVPRQFLIAQIFVAAPQGADKDAEEKALRKLEDIQKKLKLPAADFAGIARADSDERESAERGGELGWLLETQLKPEIRAQVIGLAKNALGSPVRLEDGWHLVKLADTKPAYTRPLAELRDQLAQRLREERAAANRRAYLAKLMANTPINELALLKLLGANGQDPPER